MAKQRGGSPFTDSWFEMPFWILFFLLVVTVILLWQFGIFNKPAPVAIAQPVQTKFANTNLAQPELTIEEVIPQSDAMSVKVTYSTKYTVDGQIVCIRMYETDEYIPTGATAFKFFPVGKNTVTVQNTNPAPNKHFLLESYIKAADDVSLSPLVITPFQFKSTQPGARNSSGSSDPLPSASSGPGKKVYTSPSLVGTH
jgi:hypothetical protein